MIIDSLVQHRGTSDVLAYGVKLLVLVSTVILVALWFDLAVNANLDGADGRHVLHMDERITFSGVERVQRATGPLEYVEGLAGPDQRYGRTTWYLAYAATLIGDPIAGDQGQIVSTRIFFAITLAIALGLICWSLTQSTIAACIAFACAIFTPYASYYATMPKPEPLLFLFLGLFMACAFRWHKPTGRSFIFLGLAYGTKISALPAIALLGGFVLLRAALNDSTTLIKKTMHSAGAFLIGFLLAVPVLLLEFPRGIKKHLGQTWGARGHGADDENIGPSDWFQYIESHAYFGSDISPFLIMPGLALLGTLPFLFVLLKANDENLFEKAKRAIDSHEAQVAVIAAIGIAFLAAIMISVQRLWGFYLFPGALFLTVAAVAGAETLITSSRHKLAIKATAALAILLAAPAILVSGYEDSSRYFKALAARSERPNFIQQEFRYQSVLKFSEHLATEIGRPVNVSMSARLWVPQSNESATFTETFGPYRHWDTNPDIVFLYPIDLNEDAFVLRGTPMDTLRERSLKMLKAHSTFDGPCTDDHCYVYIPVPDDGMHFFVKEEWETIATHWIKSGILTDIPHEQETRRQH